MKATGIVRKVDELGRVVVPIEHRRTLGIDIKDPLEIFTDGDKIILRKYQPGCVVCGETEDVQNFKGKHICADCIHEISIQAV
ncbi:AbrB/MazE/SpoVT family DNA-binding domain-containing protein [Alicyclobacillus fastidiosus]|uniref:AbrB/MazE/SpoVT family DNA-binding domain-containing protein n=1 Tax=Alicyclobacillus fastidiosus TaxID=392011 RepID=A0ABV5ALL0_9BACL|nr:AbrB/MazE/SpoVT family DNA-binding domain-containing protein [Alicyclobacillus fastidiosus]WEH08503.1 AbrB/MazE/SpoVT family DNA-binding domain-containing protein [Alicyclobacillus fastidiosus]